jgi:hypothetical protein
MHDYIFSNDFNQSNNKNDYNYTENKEILQKKNNNKNKLSQIKTKLNKNKYFIALVSIIIAFYYFFLFQSIFPLYEASCVYQNKKFITSVIKNGTNLKKINKKIRNLENPINYENDLQENYLFTQNRITELSKTLFNNKGFIYLTLFKFSFLLFLVSICRLSVMDPGKLESEYKNVFNVRQYCEFYFNFCRKHSLKLNNLDLDVESKKLQASHDNIANTYNNFAKNNDILMLENLKLFLISKTREINSTIKATDKKSNFFDFNKKIIFKGKLNENNDLTNNNNISENQLRANTNCEDQDEIEISRFIIVIYKFFIKKIFNI